MPSYSVVIPLYNKERHIARAVRSALGQDTRPLEVIVVDDGSTDGSAEAVRSLDSPDVLLVSQENGGASAARNRGIREARGEFVAFLDADDEWKPHFLSVIDRLRRACPDAGLYGTGYEVSDGGPPLPITHPMYAHPWEGVIGDLFAALPLGAPFNSSCAAVPREVFDAAGLFREGERIGEDTDMWCRIALRFPVAFSSEVCAVYHRDADNRAYVGGRAMRASGYIETLDGALADPDTPAKWRRSLSILREDVELGALSSLVLAGQKKEALDVYKGFEWAHMADRARLWRRLNRLPAWVVRAMMKARKKR